MENTITSEETMRERGFYTANGYTFKINPVYFGEEDFFLTEVQVSPVPMKNGIINTEILNDDKQLSYFIMYLFSEELNGAPKKRSRFSKSLFDKFGPKNYRYYKDVPLAQTLIKWVEKKVSYKNKRIRFYDLERKYGLSKAEIGRLLAYLYQLSGF